MCVLMKKWLATELEAARISYNQLRLKLTERVTHRIKKLGFTQQRTVAKDNHKWLAFVES